MSLTRSMGRELCDFVQHKPSNILGQKFFDIRVVLQVEVAYKPDKYESRVLALSKFRVFLLNGKTPGSLKIDRSFHVLTIRSLHIIAEDELVLSVDEGGSRRRMTFKGNPAHTVAHHLLCAIKHYFPDIAPVLRNLLDVQPTSLLLSFDEIKIEVAPRPCHSFRRTYAALCDYFDQPYREEVSWDVEKIYALNNLTEMRVEDFSHLLPKDLLPIVGVMQYSSYFTGLVVDSLKLSPDLVDVVLSVIRRSHWLTHLKLVACGLPKDFVTLFSSAAQQNPNLPLEILDLSRNSFDDKKGFQALSSCLPRIVSLRQVNLSDCALTDKCCTHLSSALYGALSPSRSTSSMQLTHLNLAKNNLNGDVSSLVNLVSTCNTLRVLDVSDTQFPLDRLWPVLKYGALQLERLILAGCHVGSKKGASESTPAIKEFFSMAVGLVEIDLSRTILPPDILKAMLLGLACNHQLKPFSLSLNGSVDKGGASVLEAGLPGVAARSLALRDNNFEAEFFGVIAALGAMTHLRRLDIGGSNVSGLRRSGKQRDSQTINKILLELVKLLGDDGHLEELILAEARLGAHLSVLLNTLGATACLRCLDVSSNEMGNFGARILSKALQLNVSMRTLHIDGNHITAEGFSDIATAMTMNHNLVTLPYPVLDASEALLRNDKARALSALALIETFLERNNAQSAPENANFKRAVFTLAQISDGMSLDSIHSSEGILRGARQTDSLLPLSIRSSLSSFVEQIRGQMRSHVSDALSHCDEEQADESIRQSEAIALDRLGELLLRDITSVFTEWKWRAACATAEGALRAGANTSTGSMGGVSGGGVSPCSALASPRVPRIDGHRPRSIVGDCLSSPLTEESGVSLETPPKPSALVHLAKGRPRPHRRAAVITKQRSGSTQSEDMARSLCETDEDARSEQSDEQPKKPLCERPVFRVAMLPEASLLAGTQLKPATDRAIGSPNFEKPESRVDSMKDSLSPEPEESPPPVPRRFKAVEDGSPPTTPPQLPPKPNDSRFVFGVARNNGARGDAAHLTPGVRTGAMLPTVPPPPVDDDENANNRRSVADMARLFNR